MVREADIITRDCKVILKELSKDEIDLWMKTAVLPEFPEFMSSRTVGGHIIRAKPDPPRHNTRPLRSNSVKNYEGLDDNSDSPSPKRPHKRTQSVKKDGPSAERMAAREYSLRNHAKDKTPPLSLPASPPTKRDRKVLTDPNVDVTPATANPKPKGKLVVTTHRVREQKPKHRNFRCPDCDTVEHSRKDINNHFKKCHDKLFCEECGQMFNTPSSLDCHMYLHTNGTTVPLQTLR